LAVPLPEREGSPTTTSSPEPDPPGHCPRATTNRCSPNPATSSCPCSAAAPSPGSSTARPPAPTLAATWSSCAPTPPRSPRGTANLRRAGSYASTATRLDVRRLRLPRLTLDEQRRYGARFRALDAFERTLRHAGRLGDQLVRGLYDGLTDGTVTPD